MGIQTTHDKKSLLCRHSLFKRGQKFMEQETDSVFKGIT